MTTLAERVEGALAQGATVDTVARRLGMPAALVQVVVDGLAAAGRRGATTCAPTGCPTSRETAPATCLGCPLVPLGRARR